jgi:Tol biopolymer transport system component
MHEWMRRVTTWGVGLLVVLTGVSCSGGGDVTAPTTGSLEVTTATTGPEPDGDGYAVSVDGDAESQLGANASLQRDNLEAGDHSVQLTGMAANCTLAGENPRTVGIPAGETASVIFQLTCVATTGSLQITSVTTGPSPDPDGYAITLDGGDRGVLGVSGALTLDGITSGSHSVGLSGVAANCQVQGDNPRTATVTAGVSAAVAFAITCAEPPPGAGTLRITTSSTGPGQDPDGYAFAVDGGTSQPIGVNASATLANVAAGPHAVQLSGLTGNCSLQGTNPRSVTVAGGATAEVSFGVTCTAATGISRIAWVKQRNCGGPNHTAIYVMNADGSSQIPLTRSGQSVDPDWSPDGSKIAYYRFSDMDPLDGEVRLINADGTGDVKLAHGSDPQWTPDGKVSFSGPGGLTIINADGSGEPQVIGEGAYKHRWSPDGKKVVMVKYDTRGPTPDIWVMNADGSGLTQLTDNPVGGHVGSEGPAWSPDSRRIAFSREHSSTFQDIYVMNPDGSGQTNLTLSPNDLRDHRYPVWSPDGSKIAYWNDGSLYLMNPDGSSKTNLLVSAGFLYPSGDSAPIWSPDGTRIAFAAVYGIAVMNADGTDRAQLTNSSSYCDVTPTWSP